MSNSTTTPMSSPTSSSTSGTNSSSSDSSSGTNSGSSASTSSSGTSSSSTNSGIIFTALPGGTLPVRCNASSAGYYVFAAETVLIAGGDGNFPIRIGATAAIGPGLYLRAAMNRDLAVNQHLCVSAGVYDPSFTGEISVVVNCSMNGYYYQINAGDCFAQLIPERALVGAQPGEPIYCPPSQTQSN